MEVVPEATKRKSLPAWNLGDGRDEMNLAEFPLSLMADRAPKGTKTLVFEDKTWDAGRQKEVVRRLTIAGSDDYGLPTALDEDVLVALIQLTKHTNGFSEPKVAFSRYHIIQLLGWDSGGKSYKRLDDSMHRWAGVTLRYKQAWWDNRGRCWKDQAFHILESVELYGKGSEEDQLPLPLSTFTWNGVLFASFQAGFLKQFDLTLYNRLRLAGSRRAYRFLDKRFYHKVQWEFSLREFGCERVGLARTYDNANLKRKLRAIVDELVEVEYLDRLDESEQFVRVGHGDWKIVLRRRETTAAEKAASVIEESSFISRELTSRGVALAKATELSKNFAEADIAEQVEVHDWLLLRKDPRISKNPAGFLVKAIEERYPPPAGFESKEKREARLSARKNRDTSKQTQLLKEREEAAAERLNVANRRVAVEAHLLELTELERMGFEAAAFENASEELRRYYENSKRVSGGRLFEEARCQVLFDEVQRREASVTN